MNNIPDSHVLIFAKRLLVKGRLAKCSASRPFASTAPQNGQRMVCPAGRGATWLSWKHPKHAYATEFIGCPLTVSRSSKTAAAHSSIIQKYGGFL